MKWILVAMLVAGAGAPPGGSHSVRGSKHDLSVTGPGPIKAESEREVCIFCHVPHFASDKADHLSGRPEIGKTHVPYESSTSLSRPRAPTGPSRVCLSCHDGTIAVGETLAKGIRMNAAAPDGKIPASRRSNLGTDLRKTHPISFVPPGSATLRRPPVTKAVHLDDKGEIQCTSCHDPHSEYGGSPEGKFLLEPTAESELCVTCHVLPMDASHARSTRAFGKAEGNESRYSSVGNAGCMACHRSHGADVRGRLLARADTDADDALCLRCHGGTAARTDIARELSKPSAHAVSISRGRHDPSEGPGSSTHRLPETSMGVDRHVACVDCHDPHAATDRDAVAPEASGRVAGVWGIDQAGNRVVPATKQYEICLKCHGDSANKPTSTRPFAPRRAAEDENLRRVFDQSAPSNHPVMAPVRNSRVPRKLSRLSIATWVYCTDCHSDDDGPGAGGAGPRGPHGSIYPPLLERNYTTQDRSAESPEAYALCYKCHDRTALLSSSSAFPLHKEHVAQYQAPCSVCHDAHGVSAAKGTATNNAHLVDFDLNVVKSVAGAIRPYTSTGAGSGSCSLTCHEHTHRDSTYPLAARTILPSKRRGLLPPSIRR